MDSDNIQFDKECDKVLKKGFDICVKYKNEYITPEHCLLALCNNKRFEQSTKYHFDLRKLKAELRDHIQNNMEQVEGLDIDMMELSAQGVELYSSMLNNAYLAHAKHVTLSFLFQAIYNLEDSTASYLLKKNEVGSFGEALTSLILSEEIKYKKSPADQNDGENPFDFNMEEGSDYFDYPDQEEYAMAEEIGITCINDNTSKHVPLVGRKEELERTIQILCRRDKNNPLHIGEPGVGKTALVYGLADMINRGEVPARLKDHKIYELNVFALLAGAQFRGQFEERLRNSMERIIQKGKSIVYIDEFHTLSGAGASTENNVDATNILKPYFEDDRVQFIGSTNYDSFNKTIANNKSILRCFHQIDIHEPSIEDSIKILKQRKSKYEEYHNVSYTDDAIEYAVRASAQYITNRYLPDKAIDLIDEAGAFTQTKTKKATEPTVIDKDKINSILYKVCKIEAKILKDESDNHLLESLEQNILSQIYGQDVAVKQLVEAIQMSKAGLLDENKPISSLLFVGPTGVGKTELCKVLAEQMGISLVRFDMSEYTEKHTVAKLIGSPAGYVGYDDGGLLTKAISNTPNCVLLLDEIEKAHSDIFNILLQVMDYASLTDSKGHKTDFRHVVLVMTSNAGAQFAHQASIGFGSRVTAGTAMMAQVKKTFKPEFINRLNDIVVFNDMDERMAELIMEKKVKILQKKLEAKKIKLSLTKEAKAFLLSKGFSKEYGAREMDRAIHSNLTTLLTKEMLFGSLKNPGKAKIVVKEDKLQIKTTPIE